MPLAFSTSLAIRINLAANAAPPENARRIVNAVCSGTVADAADGERADRVIASYFPLPIVAAPSPILTNEAIITRTTQGPYP